MHRLDPRVKALFVAVGVAFIFTTDDWRLLAAMLIVNLALIRFARLPLGSVRPLGLALLSFGVIILVFQLLFQPGEVLVSLGPIDLHSRGLTVTLEVWPRLANLALFFVCFTMWTHPMDIVQMFDRAGLPYRYAMLINLALRFFPVLQHEMRRIQDAQQARGLDLEGAWKRVLGLRKVLLPMLLRVLRRTEDIAVSMELRGYGYDHDRTYVRRIRLRPVDSAALVVLTALLAGVVVVELAGPGL